MPRVSRHLKETNFTMRIDPKLKAAFLKAANAEDKPAAQLVRTFMRAYIERNSRRALEAEAERQSRLIASIAKDELSEENAVMREMEAELRDETLWNE